MGWGATPKDRGVLLGPCRAAGRTIQRSDDQQPCVYVVDGNATFRSFASACPDPRPATMVASMVLRSLVPRPPKPAEPDTAQPAISAFFAPKPHPRGEGSPPKRRRTEPAKPVCVVIMFDEAAKMMPQRGALHAERYKKPLRAEVRAAAAAAAKRAQTAALSEPVQFKELFDSGAGKLTAYKLLAGACFTELTRISGYDDNALCSFAVCGPTGTVAARGPGFPPGWQAAAARWGEADQKCYEAAAAFGAEGWETAVVTIDTDMVLQTVARHASAPPTRIALKAETVDGARLAQRFGTTPAQRLSGAFLLAAAYGCDYCKPLSFAGYRKADVALLAANKTADAADDALPITVSSVPAVLVANGQRFVCTAGPGSPAVAETNNAFLYPPPPDGAKTWTIVAAGADPVRLDPAEVRPAPAGGTAYFLNPVALHKLLGSLRRSKKKLKGHARAATFAEIVDEAIRAAWTSIYFAGAGAADVSPAKAYAGPPPVPRPSANHLAETQRRRLPLILYCEP